MRKALTIFVFAVALLGLSAAAPANVEVDEGESDTDFSVVGGEWGEASVVFDYQGNQLEDMDDPIALVIGFSNENHDLRGEYFDVKGDLEFTGQGGNDYRYDLECRSKPGFEGNGKISQFFNTSVREASEDEVACFTEGIVPVMPSAEQIEDAEFDLEVRPDVRMRPMEIDLNYSVGSFVGFPE